MSKPSSSHSGTTTAPGLEELARRIGFSQREIDELRTVYAGRMKAESAGTPEADLGQREEKQQ